MKLSMRKYYWPYAWLFYTRASKIDLFNIITIFINYSLVSFMFLTIYYGGIDIWVIDYIVAFTGMMVLYEWGYIFNDTVTIQYDNDPTYRIKKEDVYAMPKHLENLLTIRLIYFLVAICWLYNRYPDTILTYILLSAGLLVAYSIHNYVRSGWNGVTFFIVVHFKYFVPLSIFLSVKELCYYYLWISLVAVVEQSILRWSDKKYFTYRFVSPKNYGKFRALYFGIVNLLFIIASYNDVLDYKYCVLPLFYLVYRIICLLASRNKVINRAVQERRNMHKVKD